MNSANIQGQCFCGHVQFTLEAQPGYACHCHCESCQRASGAPYVTWATFPIASFVLTKGRLTEHNSSPSVERTHCPECGTSISYFHSERPDEIDITATCLDRPSRVVPKAHIWIEDKQPWLEIGDDLPQYARRVSDG